MPMNGQWRSFSYLHYLEMENEGSKRDDGIGQHIWGRPTKDSMTLPHVDVGSGPGVATVPSGATALQ